MAQLLSLNVGLPRDIEWKGKSVYGIALFLETSYDDPISAAKAIIHSLTVSGKYDGDIARVRMRITRFSTEWRWAIHPSSGSEAIRWVTFGVPSV